MKFGENVSNILPDIVLTMFRDANTDARTDEQDKNNMSPATLHWAEAQNGIIGHSLSQENANMPTSKN